MKHTKLNRQGETTRNQIDDLLINTAYEFQAFDLPDFYIKTGREQEFLDATVALKDQGCNPVTLHWAIRLGQATKGKEVGAIPTAKEIKKLANRLRSDRQDF